MQLSGGWEWFHEAKHATLGMNSNFGIEIRQSRVPIGLEVGDADGDGALRGGECDSVRGSTCLMAQRVRGQNTNISSH